MKLDVYRVLVNAVIEGVAFGVNRAHKHTDAPDKEMLKERVVDEVMIALDQVVDWGRD